MASSSLLSASTVEVDHRGWKLHARWSRSFGGTSEGWVSYVTGPDSSHELNIGRWMTSEEALDQGRAYVDRRQDSQKKTAARLGGSGGPLNFVR